MNIPLSIVKSVVALLLLSLSIFTHGTGLMTPANGQLPKLEIKQHHVDVTIENGYAITSVTQTFFNPNDITLEAIYSFPIPEKAAVGEFTYWIDGKPITGEVLEKKEARNIYEQEKAQGRETALTEQDKYQSFDSSVYPVLPKQDVKIRLVYIQAVHVDHGIGNYVYPLEDGGVDEEKLAFWRYNDVVTQAFSFNMNIRSSYPIDDVRLPSHPQAIASTVSDQEWHISMMNGQAVNEEKESPQPSGNQNITKLNQDIVVYWKHQQGLPGSIDMVTHKEPGKEKGTFMLTITPGDDLTKISQGRDWIFVLDYSGSMQGKYHSLIEGVNKGLSKLNANDRFRIVLFNNSANELTNGYVLATTENVSRFTQKLESTKPNGGTNLYDGLKEAIKGLDSDRASAIILVTDGVANVGTTEKKSFLNLLEQYDVRLFTFVMGNGANRPLLDSMTQVSNGFAMSVSNSDDIVGKLMIATEKLTHQAFHDVEVDIDGIKVKSLTPARIGSVYRGQQLILFGHYWGDGQATIKIKGKVSGQERIYSSSFEFPKQSELNPEIERLWAFATIEALLNKIDYLGEDADTKQAIVDIAKQYSLVTDYTSMIVVREEVFKQLNISQNNAKRIKREIQAKQQRANQAVQDNRKDSHKQAFNNTRAYPKSGGGAIDVWLVLQLTAGLFVARKSKQAI
jgi:Ca-activated chloride channel family protein